MVVYISQSQFSSSSHSPYPSRVRTSVLCVCVSILLFGFSIPWPCNLILTIDFWSQGPSPQCSSSYIFFLAQKVKVKSFSRVRLFAIPWTVVYQASLSMGFSRQEYWSGLPLPSPGDLPDPGIKPRCPTLQADALPSEPPGKFTYSSPKYYNFFK